MELEDQGQCIGWRFFDLLEVVFRFPRPIQINETADDSSAISGGDLEVIPKEFGVIGSGMLEEIMVG